MNSISPPSYYMMDATHDLFAWLGTLPAPRIPEDIQVEAIAEWTTGLRYARRCLYKETSPYHMAKDAKKAATCFLRLAELLGEYPS